MGYIVTLGQEPNTYKGWRAATEDFEVNQGELFVETLEGYTPEATKPTGPEIASTITSLLLELPLATQAGFSQATATIGYFLDKNNPALALALLQEVSVPQNLEPLKAAVAAEIQKGV